MEPQYGSKIYDYPSIREFAGFLHKQTKNSKLPPRNTNQADNRLVLQQVTQVKEEKRQPVSAFAAGGSLRSCS